jgi:hypothetical protein
VAWATIEPRRPPADYSLHVLVNHNELAVVALVVRPEASVTG